MTIEVSSDKVVSSNNLPNYWTRNRQSLLNYIAESLNGFRGIVTDSVTGQPVEARVFVENHDMDNTHTFSRMPLGDYHRPIKGGTWQVTFSAEGYHTKTLTMNILDGQTLVQDVQLVPDYVGVEENEAVQVCVFPNPASDAVRIESNGAAIMGVEVFDLSGRRLSQQSLTGTSARVDLKMFAAGIYNLRIVTENGTVTKRIIRLDD